MGSAVQNSLGQTTLDVHPRCGNIAARQTHRGLFKRFALTAGPQRLLFDVGSWLLGVGCRPCVCDVFGVRFGLDIGDSMLHLEGPTLSFPSGVFALDNWPFDTNIWVFEFGFPN